MKYLLITTLLLHFLGGYSQKEIARIPVKIKGANEIYNNKNKLGIHAFYFDLTDKYQFLITDSAFNVIYQIKDSYRSTAKVSLVGSISSDTGFLYVFKRNIDNELFFLNVDFKNKKVHRTKSLKVYSSSKYELRKYINTQNRLFLLTTSINNNIICFFEVVDEETVIPHSFNNIDKNAIKDISSGWFNTYYFDSTSFNFLVDFKPDDSKLNRFSIYDFDIEAKKYSGTTLNLGDLNNNRKKAKDKKLLSGKKTRSNTYIAGKRKKGSELTINKYITSTQNAIDSLSINLSELALSNRLQPNIIDFNRRTIEKTKDLKLIEDYLSSSFSFDVSDNNSDSTNFNLTFYKNTSSSTGTQYHSEMRINLLVDNSKFQILSFSPDTNVVIHNQLIYILNKWQNDFLLRPSEKNPTVTFFLDKNKNSCFGYIDNMEREFVIEVLD